MSAEPAAVARGLESGRSGGPAVWVLAALFLIGLATLVYGLSDDSVEIDFPLFTASFLYLTGISQAAIVFAAIMRVVGAQWSKPYYRLAELTTLAFAPFAIACFLLIFYFARDELFYWIAQESGLAEDAHVTPWLNVGWLFARNLLALLLFYGLSLVYALKAIKPDLLQRAGAPAADLEATERRLYLMSPWIILSFGLCNTFLAWDFAMMLIEHWHSTVFPIYFSFGNLFAGSAALVFFVAILGSKDRGVTPFGPDQVRCLGMLLTGFTVLWLYFFWAQFFVIWFGNLPRETDPLWNQMYGHYAPFFWIMMAGCFFVPFASFVFAAVKRSVFAMCVLAAVINIGIWLNKYLMVVPVFSAEDVPFDHWLDVSLAVGLLSGFLAVLILLARRVPIFSEWELSRRPQPTR